MTQVKEHITWLETPCIMYVQYRGGGGGGGLFSTMEDIILCYLSTVGEYHDTRGGYYEYHRGYNKRLLPPCGTHHIPSCIMIPW